MNNRDIILLLRGDDLVHHDIDMEVKCIHEIIASVETVDAFCEAHELVQRNRITQKKYKILDAISEGDLKPFHFLISRN